MIWEILWQFYVQIIFFHPQDTAMPRIHSLQQISLFSVSIQNTDHPADIRPLFSLFFFQIVKLLQNSHRQDHFIFLKAFDGIRCLDQYIGIQDIDFFHKKPLYTFIVFRV